MRNLAQKSLKFDRRSVGVYIPPPAADYPAEMQAILTSLNGFVLDAKDLTKLWKDSGITPVAANGDPVQQFDGKWGTSGNPTWQQLTAGNQPAWNSAGSLAFSTDDRLVTSATYAPYTSLNGCHYGIRAVTTSLAANQTIFGFSTSGTTITRTQITIYTDGSINTANRRLNADTPVTITSAPGLITVGVPFTAQVEIDYVATTISLILNGTVVATGNLAVSGQSDPSGSARPSIGASVANTNFFNGNIGNAFFACGTLSAGQKASAKGWLELTL